MVQNQITLASDVSSLPLGRAFISDACKNLSVDKETMYDILLAVDEVLSNIIEHGYAGLEPGEIILAWRQDGGRLILEFTDFGHVFEPTQPEKPDIEAIFNDGRQGGLGLYMVYHYMDEISYQAGGDRNTLTLVKKLGKD